MDGFLKSKEGPGADIWEMVLSEVLRPIGIMYAPIMRTIAETGYEGYVAQEFIPTRDPVKGLWQAVKLCDV
jgi:hypothetical protein